MQSLWRYPFALLGIVFILIGVALWPHSRTIPVLIYHDVSSQTLQPDSYTVEVSLLGRELDYMLAEGYTPLTFATAMQLHESGKLPNKPIVISFDDAQPGQMLALQELTSRRVPASFFIPSDLVGDAVHLNWNQVRSIAAAGMEIGGHTANHVRVSQINASGLENEIMGDKQHIEAEIGKSITVFAYPFQEVTTDAQVIAKRAGYTIIRDDPKQFKSTVMTNSFESLLKAL